MSLISATYSSRSPVVARATICEAARQLGVNSQNRTVVLDLAAVAITRMAWRDSPIEDWHAGPDSRISDPELMRANAATTRLTRSVLELHAPQPPDRLNHGGQKPRHNDADHLFTGTGHALAAPHRRLPDARTVGELAPSGIELASYTEHVSRLTCEWTNASRHLGTQAVLVLLANLAASIYRDWWLAPDWPRVVAQFTTYLKNPDRACSPTMITRLKILTPPPQAADPDQLRRLLLAGPDLLHSDTATYCLRAGIGTLVPIR